jgi:EAL domain-containing protein (putative c-di-GMP-specific phosphodiesterase class I)
MLVRVAAFRSAAALVAAGAPSAPAEVWVREGGTGPPASQSLLDHHLDVMRRLVAHDNGAGSVAASRCPILDAGRLQAQTALPPAAQGTLYLTTRPVLTDLGRQRELAAAVRSFLARQVPPGEEAMVVAQFDVPAARSSGPHVADTFACTQGRSAAAGGWSAMLHLEPAWTVDRLQAARVPQTRIEWQAWLDDLEQHGEVAFRSQHVVDGGGQGRILSRELLLGQNKGLTVGGIIPPLIAHGLTHRLDCLALPSAAQVLATRGDIEHVSFNLSGLVLDDPSFPARVRACLAEKGVDPRQIGFELIETGPPPNPWIGRQVVAELKAAGHRIYIDDVGQGRSLGHFVWLPPELIDVIKIDAAYVGAVTRKPTVYDDVRRMIDTAHAYGIQAVAEGVEDEETALAMAAAGVDYQQGFFWHRPEPLLL